MDPIFDRLGSLLRSFFQDDGPHYHRNSNVDEDFQTAWDELNDFLSGSDGTSKSGHSSPKSDAHSGSAGTGSSRVVPQELRDDYKLLQVRFGAPFDEVHKAYKKLLLKNHPDYHQNEPQRATHMTQKLNYSFQRIKNFEQTGRV